MNVDNCYFKRSVEDATLDAVHVRGFSDLGPTYLRSRVPTHSRLCTPMLDKLGILLLSEQWPNEIMLGA